MRPLLLRCALAGAALLAAALVGYAAYVELGGPEEQAVARARGCTLCHGTPTALPDALSRLRPGEPLRPLLQRRIAAAHPLLSRGAEEQLAEIAALQLLPALAAARGGQPGRTLYIAKCAACHGRDGEGAGDDYPPLRGSAWLTDEPSRLPEVLTRGLSERIEVRGRVWDKTMRAPGLTSPQQVRHLIDFLRATFAR